MKGNGNLLGGNAFTEVIASAYTTNFKGLRPRFSSKALNLDWTASCSTGNVIPDPVLVKGINSRRSLHEKDLKRMAATRTSAEK